MTEDTLVPDAVATHEGTPPAEVTPESSEPTGSEQVVTPETEAPEGAPESEATEVPQTWENFTLNAPEGHDQETLATFGKLAQEVGVAPQAAQKMLDGLIPVIQERQVAGINAMHEEWIANAKADPEIGGAKFDENLALAKKGAEHFGDDELQTLLKPVSEGGQGLGNHPAITRLLYRVGKALRPDTTLVTGKPAEAERSMAKTLFPNSRMND